MADRGGRGWAAVSYAYVQDCRPALDSLRLHFLSEWSLLLLLLQVRIDYAQSGRFADLKPILTTPVPAALLAETEFRFGITGVTGSYFNNYELLNVEVDTLQPLGPLVIDLSQNPPAQPDQFYMSNIIINGARPYTTTVTDAPDWLQLTAADKCLFTGFPNRTHLGLSWDITLTVIDSRGSGATVTWTLAVGLVSCQAVVVGITGSRPFLPAAAINDCASGCMIIIPLCDWLKNTCCRNDLALLHAGIRHAAGNRRLCFSSIACGG